MDVYTFPSFRGKGYAGHVISEAMTKAVKPVFLMCDKELRQFYEHFGFSECQDAPGYMSRRVRRVNELVGRFNKKAYVVMGNADRRIEQSA